MGCGDSKTLDAIGPPPTTPGRRRSPQPSLGRQSASHSIPGSPPSTAPSSPTRGRRRAHGLPVNEGTAVQDGLGGNAGVALSYGAPAAYQKSDPRSRQSQDQEPMGLYIHRQRMQGYGDKRQERQQRQQPNHGTNHQDRPHRQPNPDYEALRAPRQEPGSQRRSRTRREHPTESPNPYSSLQPDQTLPPMISPSSLPSSIGSRNSFDEEWPPVIPALPNSVRPIVKASVNPDAMPQLNEGLKDDPDIYDNPNSDLERVSAMKERQYRIHNHGAPSRLSTNSTSTSGSSSRKSGRQHSGSRYARSRPLGSIAPSTSDMNLSSMSAGSDRSSSPSRGRRQRFREQDMLPKLQRR